MSDYIPSPNVVTNLKIGDFTLHIYAYRKLTRSECQTALMMYMRNSHLQKLPSSGSGKVITLFGMNPSDGL